MGNSIASAHAAFYVPAASALCAQVLSKLHLTQLGGHFSRDKTLAVACCLVWWPVMPAVVEYGTVRTCPTCQRVYADHLPPAGLLHPIPVHIQEH